MMQILATTLLVCGAVMFYWHPIEKALVRWRNIPLGRLFAIVTLAFYEKMGWTWKWLCLRWILLHFMPVGANMFGILEQTVAQLVARHDGTLLNLAEFN